MVNNTSSCSGCQLSDFWGFCIVYGKFVLRGAHFPRERTRSERERESLEELLQLMEHQSPSPSTVSTSVPYRFPFFIIPPLQEIPPRTEGYYTLCACFFSFFIYFVLCMKGIPQQPTLNMNSQLLLILSRWTMVNRTYGTDKSLHISLFLL